MNKLIIFTLFVLSVVTVNAQQERKFIRQGNREYNRAVIDSVTTDTTYYKSAENYYREALDKDPNNWDATYNLANSLYKQGNFEEAIRQYQAVTGMNNENKDDLARAYHNMGNSYLQGDKLDEAIEAFKSSLRNNPNDFDVKYNLAWTQNKKRQQEQQQQQNEDQNKDQDQNEDQKDQDKDQQNKDDQDKKDKENQDKQDQQQNKDKQEDQQQQQQQPQNKISKEDAMRILEALQNDEKEVQEKVQKQKDQPKKRRIEKDW